MAKTDKATDTTLADSPSHLLHRALQLALDVYADEADGLVTQRQFAVLSAVADHEGLSQTDLVRATGIDRSTLADLVGRMIGKGFLERERSAKDARAKTVRLAKLGRDALAQAAPRAAAADAKLMKLLGERKGEKFIASLQALIAAGEKTLGKAGAEDAGRTAKPPKAEKAKVDKIKAHGRRRKKDKRAKKAGKLGEVVAVAED